MQNHFRASIVDFPELPMIRNRLLANEIQCYFVA
jgi:hypothetical protein